MICPKCGGSGKIFCSMCKGTGLYHGEDGITNEEWFDGLSTEEKAKWITENLSVYADDWVKSDEKLLNPVTWEEWLKEKHDEM